MIRRRRGSGRATVGLTLLLAASLAAAGACAEREPAAAAATPPRAGRFGSLRDFVLIERGTRDRTEPLFVDRFEVTRADWAEFAATPAGRAVDAGAAVLGGDPTLPVSLVDLRQARAFARWRFARLPQRSEWQAAVGDGRHAFPWGSKTDATRANTAELGLGEPVPVGTFEAGRRTGGEQPYDLVGNVSEWTETVATGWTEAALDPGASLMAGRAAVLQAPALSLWQGVGGIVPLCWAAEAGGERVPREVVGADFQAQMAATSEPVLAGDRRLRTGLRLVATPRELLGWLLAADVEPRAEELVQVRRFVQRDQHRTALANAWPSVAAAADVGRPLHALLRDELAR